MVHTLRTHAFAYHHLMTVDILLSKYHTAHHAPPTLCLLSCLSCLASVSVYLCLSLHKSVQLLADVNLEERGSVNAEARGDIEEQTVRCTCVYD